MSVEDFEIIQQRVEKLTPDPRNSRVHPQHQIEELQRGLRRFGFQGVIVVDKRSGYVVSGHGMLEAAKAEGYERVPVHYTDFEDANERALLRQFLNRSAERSYEDYELLAANLQELHEAGFNLEELGWPEKDLEPLLAADFVPDVPGDLHGDAPAPGGSDSSGETVDEQSQGVTTLTFEISVELSETVAEAMEKAQQTTGAEDDGAALYEICRAWMEQAE